MKRTGKYLDAGTFCVLFGVGCLEKGRLKVKSPVATEPLCFPPFANDLATTVRSPSIISADNVETFDVNFFYKVGSRIQHKIDSQLPK